jgi:Ca2+-binding RTX toxin-like protein
MPQTNFDGTAGNDLLDASGLTTAAFLRGGAGNDTLLGGAGNDRLDGGLGRDLLRGGAGDDVFYVTLGRDLGTGERDSIEGGTGNDQLSFTLSAAQAALADIQAELARLVVFLATTFTTDPTAHFTSDTLHLDLLGIEAVTVRAEGAMTPIG